MFKKINKVLVIIFIANMVLSCSNKITNPPETTENKMYVYSNSGRTFYLVDYKNFEIVKEIQIAVNDTISCSGMTLSTNRDYLFLIATGENLIGPFGFVIYNIVEEKLENIFFTDFKNDSPAYFISAQNNSEPGLIYVHFRDHGTYSIDLFEKKVKEFISDEHGFDLDKRIFNSSDGLWTIVKKNWAAGYTELEFYSASSGLHDLQFTLNENNADSISIYDFEFSEDNKLFITYQLSGGRSRGIESYFGSYDLETKQLYRSSLKFPWSLNPYYTAYSSTRNEVYTIGAYDKLYVINTNNYMIKNIITLSGKSGPSMILISPDEDKAFVNCPYNNSIYVIDLNTKRVIKIIEITKPANFIIP